MADQDRTAIAEALEATSIESDSTSLEVRKIEVTLALVMMGTLDGHVDRKKAWKPGYLVPRFVMDAAKLAGFQRIRYRSARAFDGQNLVLFRRDWPAECIGDSARHEEKGPPGTQGL